MRANGGFENWDFIILEKYSATGKTDLLWKEREWFDRLKPTLNCLKPTMSTEERKQCIENYRNEHKEELKEYHNKYDKKYRQENSEKLFESQKKYRQENSEKIKENKQKYYQENKEKHPPIKAECEICNISLNLTYMKKHETTKKHLMNIEKNKQPVEILENNFNIHIREMDNTIEEKMEQKPKKTQAQIQADYRARKRAADPNYDQKILDYKKAHRASKRAALEKKPVPVSVPVVETNVSVPVEQEAKSSKTKCDVVNNSIHTIVSITGNGLGPSMVSIKKYHRNIHNLYKDLYGTELDCSAWDWTRTDFDKIVHFVETKYPNNNTRKEKISSLTSYLKYLANYRDVYEKYSKQLEIYSGIYKAAVESNVPTTKQIERYIAYDELLKKVNKVEEPADKLLMTLYTLVPPRRLKDYNQMKVVYLKNRVKKKKSATAIINGLPDNFNYLILGQKNDAPFKFVFKNYKAGALKVLGIQDIPIDVNVRKIITRYLQSSKKKDDDFLFTDNLGKAYSQSGFSHLVSSTFQKYTNIPLSINDLRHLYISFMEENNNLSIADRKVLASKIGQSSINTFLEYVKYFKDEE